jgi:hypothetical protein
MQFKKEYGHQKAQDARKRPEFLCLLRLFVAMGFVELL